MLKFYKSVCELGPTTKREKKKEKTCNGTNFLNIFAMCSGHWDVRKAISELSGLKMISSSSQLSNILIKSNFIIST